MTTTDPVAAAYVAAEVAARHDPGIADSMRFRRVSTRYPHVVAVAYGLDLARAAADTDEQVAATVAAWERAQGVEPHDWAAIGREERGEDR